MKNHNVQIIKIAFITQYGLNTGGTERFLQTVAANLPKDKFRVDYYYTGEPAEHRKKYMEDNDVNLIYYRGKYNNRFGYVSLQETDFFSVFKYDYDIIQNGRCGTPQEPFINIRNIPIIDSLHYISGVDNQYNIARVMHISEFSREMWVRMGGDKRRVVMISNPLYLPPFEYTDIRESLGLSKDTFLFGFHQADRDEIFSDIPLRAYKEVEDDSNAFILCNGSKRYREQAMELGLKNIYFYDYLKDDNEFYSVLKSLDVYTHGRKDGELNSAAIAEALSLGIPVISHPSNDFNGHLEVIDGNGFVAKDSKEYAKFMTLLENDKELRNKCGKESLRIFEERYEFNEQMNWIISIYQDVLKNPYPNKLRRRLFDMKQQSVNMALRCAKIILRPENR